MFQTQAIINKISTLADQSIRITADTPELDSPSMTELFNLRNLEGWLLFSPTIVKEADVPSEPTNLSSSSSKTPGSRLRSVLYILYQGTAKTEPFEIFYLREMEKIIDSVKHKLN